MRKLIIIILMVGFILFSCSPTLYIPASKDPVKQEKLLTGRKLYVDHCSNCHNLHLPKEFTAEKWQWNLSMMQERAKISSEEKKLILEFLTSQP